MTPEERSERLMAEASRLFVRLGYDKTTITDITRAAGASKGAFYLAFESKEAILEAVLIREMEVYLAASQEAMHRHPRAGTIGSMYEVALRALDASPVMAVLVRRDQEVFGRYLRKPDNFFQRYGSGQLTRHEIVDWLQKAGVVRADVDPKVVAHVMNLISLGWVSVGEVFPAESVPPNEDVIVGLADLMDRALTPPEGADREAGKAVLDELYAAARLRVRALLVEATGGRSES